MSFEPYREQWRGRVSEVTIGAAGGGDGTPKNITVGGAGALPFLDIDGPIPHRPAVAAEVWDVRPAWPASLAGAYGAVLGDPVAWAQKCVRDGADLICLRLAGADPEAGDASPEACAAVVRSVLDAVGVPLIILGCGNDEKDNLIFPAVCNAAEGTRCLVGPVHKDNYRTIAAAAKVAGHAVIAQSPVDVTIQKQLAILLEEMGFGPQDVVFDPTTGALGYGLDYTYSVMERIRLAALQGDRHLSSPLMVFAGYEAWRTKEAGLPGGGADQGVVWEVLTATALLHAGADIVVMLHPDAVRAVRRYLGELTGEAAA